MFLVSVMERLYALLLVFVSSYVEKKKPSKSRSRDCTMLLCSYLFLLSVSTAVLEKTPLLTRKWKSFDILML